jgi:predicted tellurium resistance membrane protein TerC
VETLFTVENLFTLLMLILLQAVLGFDNLLYISIESKRAPENKQAMVRHWGIGIAIVFRIALLFLVLQAVELFQTPFFEAHFEGIFEAEFNVHSAITLVGGAFIIYTAMKEIMHLLAVHDIDGPDQKGQSMFKVLFWIVAMNLVFSFDSILSAMALSDVFLVMAAAVVISGILMIVLSDYVAEFLKRNRMYEVMGLFILFVVGIMLVTEGGHLAHVTLAGFPVEAMSKTTFYFILAVIILTDVVQSKFRSNLMKQHAVEEADINDHES